MFELFILATLLAALAAATTTVVVRKKKRAAKELAAGPDRPALPAARQIPRGDLLPSDVVVHLGQDYLVEGVARLEEGGQTLVVVTALTGASSPLLLVQPEAIDPCIMGDDVDPSHTAGGVPSWLQVEGAGDLQLVKRVAALISVKGEVGELIEGPCDAGFYEGPGGARGVVLHTGPKSLVVCGTIVAQRGLELLPGSGD